MQLLRPGRFGTRVVARPERSHKHLDDANFSGRGIDHHHRHAGIIDECLFASRIAGSTRWSQRLVLSKEEVERYAPPLQLLVEKRPVRKWSTPDLWELSPPEESSFQLIDFRGKWPRESTRPEAQHVVPHRRARYSEAPPRRTLTQAAVKPQP